LRETEFPPKNLFITFSSFKAESILSSLIENHPLSPGYNF